MKKLLFGLICSSALFANAVIELKTPFKDAKGTVIEVWAYVCSHCAAHFKEHTLEKLANKTSLRPVEYLSDVMGDNAQMLADAFYYAQYLDLKNNATFEDSKYYALKHAIFDTKLDDVDEYNKLFKQILNKSKDELEAMRNEPWYIRLSSNRASALEVVRVMGTPGYVINGKYLINLAEISSWDEFFDLAKKLSKADRS